MLYALAMGSFKKITLKIIAFLRYYSFDLNYKGK